MTTLSSLLQIAAAAFIGALAGRVVARFSRKAYRLTIKVDGRQLCETLVDSDSVLDVTLSSTTSRDAAPSPSIGASKVDP